MQARGNSVSAVLQVMACEKESGDSDKATVDVALRRKNEVKALRQRMRPFLDKYPQYDTDYSLVRWLRGYNYDIEAAAQKMEWSLNAMGVVGAFKQDFSTVEKIHEAVRAITPVAEYFPGGMLGSDKNGNIINMHNIGKARPRSLLSSGRVSEFLRAAIFDCEGCQHLLRAEEAKRGRKLGVIMVVDFSGFSYDVVFHIPATKIYINMLKLVQTLFPDTAAKLYLVNTPIAISFLVRMVKMALATETVDRFEMLGSDWKEVLIERHGAECLPKSCGGTKSDDILRRGGEVPESIRPLIKTMYIPPEELSKLTIPARSEISIPFEVTKKETVLSWYFTCSSGDIDFRIVHNNLEVWPCFRISTEFSPEFGEIVCKEIGKYEVQFSNKHAVIWSKQIRFQMKLDE